MDIFILEQVTNGEGGSIEGLFSSYELALDYYFRNVYVEDEPWTELAGYNSKTNYYRCYFINQKELNPN